MLAVVIIVGCVAALYFIQWVIGKTTNAADRTLRRKTYAAGQSAVRTGLQITAPVPPRMLIDRIVETVNAYASAPAVVSGLYLKKCTDQMAQFAVGSKTVGDVAGAVVRLRATDQGCSGSFEVLHWRESGASVQGANDMNKIRTRIEAAVADLSGMTTAA